MTHRESIDAAKHAVLTHLARPDAGRTMGHLMVVCGLDYNVFVWDDRGKCLAGSRVLDRALQELRRSGKIVFRNRQWWLVGGAP